MAQSEHQGGCHCGAVQFRTSDDPRFVTRCHCADCRKATGAEFSTWVGFSDPAIAWLGDERRIYESSAGVRRGYCQACGTPLSYQGSKWPDETHILIGCFERPEDFRPSMCVFIDDALPWAEKEIK